MMQKSKIRIAFALMTVLLTVTCVSVIATTGKDAAKAGGYSHLTEDKKIDLEAYYSVEGASMILNEESLDFVLSGTEAVVTFDKPLFSDDFSLSFDGIEGNTLKKFEVVLTDAENPEETTSAVVESLGTETYSVRLGNAKRPVILNGSFGKKNNSDLYVRYERGTNCFSDGAFYQIPILESEDGSIFEGFSSRQVYLTLRLYGEKGSVFRLTSLNIQRMGSLYLEDTEAPGIIIEKEVKDAVLNSTIALSKASAVDVLADHATIVMSVTDPEGNEVVATDGTKLTKVVPDKEYEIKVDQYGEYIVSYQATDGTNTTREIYNQIRVIDREKPQIMLDEEMPSFVKTGDTLTFPDVEMSDNVFAAYGWTTVGYPDGRILIAEDTLTFEDEGIYEITFSAIDEAGNIGRLTVEVLAEDEK